MFENISQALLYSGAGMYVIVIPILRTIASLLMTIAVWRKLKLRGDRYKFAWLILVWYAPILAGILYGAYCRWINKKETPQIKGNKSMVVISVILEIVSAILTVIAVVLVGTGMVRSEWKDEPIETYYDAKGNVYDDVYEVPVYDEKGNVYRYESEWFGSKYVDEEGNEYDGSYCYISEDGLFYYDEELALIEGEEDLDYFTDGSTLYYNAWAPVYWDEDGDMRATEARYHQELFVFGE